MVTIVLLVDIQMEYGYSQAMQQMPLFDPSPPWTVTTLTRYIRSLLEGDSSLREVWVVGELSNLSRPSSGHIYFTLKDAGASLRCVIWRNDALRLRHALQEGMAVEAHGSIGVYESGGQYQLYADFLQPIGEGALYQEFLRLKALLEGEGLFSEERKRPIPQISRRIGVITSPTGAALRDILKTLHRRLPLVQVILASTPVQGEEAPEGIVSALEDLNKIVNPDVVILARGGGSIEDLWAFNDERVVRAISASKAPVITGVGHETDFTLVDFAADLRAPTPTAAAELATPVTITDLEATLIEKGQLLERKMEAIIRQKRMDVFSLDSRLRRASPGRRLQNERQRLDELSRRWLSAQVHRLEIEKEKNIGLGNRLVALNPLDVLRRGYAVVSKDKKIVNSIGQVGLDDSLQVRVRDGEFGVRVTENGR